jgi:Fe2+ transport system protein FeoA
MGDIDMTIKQVFDDPRTTTRNASLLAKRAGVAVKSAQAFLRDQAASQITKRATKPPESAFVPTGGPRGEWLGDTIYLASYAGVNKKSTAIFTIMEVNSRYVYARALVRATADKVAEAMTSILAENAGDVKGGVAPITAMRVDGGPEFSGEFGKLLKARGIPQDKGQPGTHERLARLDRYHGKLRRQLGELFAQRNSHVWVDVLQDLVDNHNSSPSRALDAAGRGTAPMEVTEAKEAKLRLGDFKRAAEVRRGVDKMGVVPGTQVRLLTSRLKNAPKHVKGQEATWTPELYSVIERVGPNAFKVDAPMGEVSVWPVHALQVVTKALGQSKPAGQKVDKKVVAAKKKESLSISPAENAAALAAPARAKRDRAKKVDYAKLAGKKG